MATPTCPARDVIAALFYVIRKHDDASLLFFFRDGNRVASLFCNNEKAFPGMTRKGNQGDPNHLLDMMRKRRVMRSCSPARQASRGFEAAAAFLGKYAGAE